MAPEDVIYAVRDLLKLKKPVNNVCEECQVGKQIRSTFKVKEQSSIRLLELVHTDLCGPTRTRSQQGDMYFILLIDDYSKKTGDFFERKIKSSTKVKDIQGYGWEWDR